jgi:hypothetical protein
MRLIHGKQEAKAPLQRHQALQQQTMQRAECLCMRLLQLCSTTFPSLLVSTPHVGLGSSACGLQYSSAVARCITFPCNKNTDQQYLACFDHCAGGGGTLAWKSHGIGANSVHK